MMEGIESIEEIPRSYKQLGFSSILELVKDYDEEEEAADDEAAPEQGEDPNGDEDVDIHFLCDVAQDISLEPIKYQKGDSDGCGGGRDGDEGKKVGFASTVSVLPIPSRLDYTDQTRQAVWSDKREISLMTARNMLEFAAEGWDWRNAAEDEQMVILEGRPVHPVHTNFCLREALLWQIPYPRAVTPPEEDLQQQQGPGSHYHPGSNDIFNHPHAMDCADDTSDEWMLYGNGAIYDDVQAFERPGSPFVESVVLNDEANDYDSFLLESDPDQFLHQRFSPSYQRHHFRQDVPFGPSEDVYCSNVLYSTTNY